MDLRRKIRFSDAPAARVLRSIYYLPSQFSLPAPRFLVVPLRIGYTSVRSAFFFLRRTLIAEPFFKSYCESYGKSLHTGVFTHWIQGNGSIILGDDVLFDGKCSFKFAARYSAKPTFSVGNRSGFGHGCSFTVAKSITFGNDCRVAGGVVFFDAPGHATDPEQRLAGAPADDADVRPISIGNNVWIGSNSIIFPGVTIGDNSIVAMGSSVMTTVPPDTVVAGNPARSMKSLARNKDA